MPRSVALVLGLCALGAWLLGARVARRTGRALPTSSLAAAETGQLSAALQPEAHPPTRTTQVSVEPRVPLRAAPASAGVAHASAGEHAHPITAQHQALRAQQQLVAALNDALDLRDAAAMRSLIERYDALSPEDPLRLSEGYERVTDCLEALDPVRRASAREDAQRYYDDARASSLRRYVRRVCLEPDGEAP